MKINKYIKKTIISLIGAGLLLSTIQEISYAHAIPTVEMNGMSYPDWDSITFSNLPGISESGSFTVPSQYVSQIGYDPSRSWLAGETPDRYLMLGDFQDAFELQALTLRQIATKTSTNLSNLSLADFGVVKYQTIGSLVDAIPSLASKSIDEVPIIGDLLAKEGYLYEGYNTTIGSLLNSNLASLSLSELPLEEYGISEIPGLSQTQLEQFADWRAVFIDEIPGLGDLPFSEFPDPPALDGDGVGIVDLVLGSLEQRADRTISGSKQAGFNVPCYGRCAHTELVGPPNVFGKQWVSGIDQEVEGGFGFLKAVNGVKEPTGRHPYGKKFKIAITNVDESDGRLDTSMYFRFCIKTMFVHTCTPYFIGPIPFMSHHEKDPIFLGQ